MKYYKLLTQKMTSYQGTKWEIGVPITMTKEGNRMCSDEVLHCYNHPLLAIILNPIHADIRNPRLYEISVDEIVATDGLKFASKSQTLIRELSIPEISLEQKVEFGIRVAKLVCEDKKWNAWADSWLDGTDKTRESAAATAATAATAAADTAATAAAWATDATATDWATAAAATAAYAAAAARSAKNEFNQKMIEIIESILDKRQG